MVQNLNLIMITSPELSVFRKRLKTLESKVGTLFVNEQLFETDYRFVGRSKSLRYPLQIMVA